MRVLNFLADHHVVYQTVVHPPAYTATKRAHYLHVPGRLLAKSVLLAGPRGHLLAVLPATCQVDREAVARAMGGPVRLARVEEIAQVFGDCEWGVAVPFGTLYGIPTLLDESFDLEAELVFEAQMHAVAIRMRCCDFERLEKPRRLRLARIQLSGDARAAIDSPSTGTTPDCRPNRARRASD
jgi:Ala-tRNA(Pro) deacylase